MILNIYRNPNSDYNFLLRNELIFTGIEETKIFSNIIRKLFNSENKLISNIQIKGTIFPIPKANYSIQLFLEKEYNTVLVSNRILKPIWYCYFCNDKYEIVEHIGLKSSIFKNNIQIGYFEKKSTSLFNGYVIKLIINNNENIALICSFVLAIGCSFDNDGSLITFDLGNIFGEAKKFDKNWKSSNI